MNILLLNWRDMKNPLAGGAEVATNEHVKAWMSGGNHVYWVSAKFNGAKDQEDSGNLHVIRKGNFVTIYIWAIFVYYFSGIHFDLVVDQMHGIPFFTPLYVRVPIIVFIHEIAGEIWDYMYPFPVNIFGRFIEKILLLPYRNKQFMTVSESTKKDLIAAGIPGKNIVICINGITNKPLERIPQKEKIPTFLFVSRVVRMKGIEEVIKAFGFITQHIPSSQLWVVGGGVPAYLEQLSNMAKEYGVDQKIFFLGRLSESEKLKRMRRAHMLLHASVKEGWGLVVVEAASQATPSIVYNVPGLRDSVKDDVTGVVLRKNTPSAMAEAAVLLLKDKRRYAKFQKACLSFAGSVSWENASKKSSDLLKKCI